MSSLRSGVASSTSYCTQRWYEHEHENTPTRMLLVLRHPGAEQEPDMREDHPGAAVEEVASHPGESKKAFQCNLRE